MSLKASPSRSSGELELSGIDCAERVLSLRERLRSSPVPLVDIKLLVSNWKEEQLKNVDLKTLQIPAFIFQ
jgi:hypothetical protein